MRHHRSRISFNIKKIANVGCIFIRLRLMKIPCPLVQYLAILYANESNKVYLFPINLHVLRLHDNTQPSPTSDAVRPLSIYAASLYAATSALLRPLPLHCDRSPHYCGRSKSESDCVRGILRSGMHLWATIFHRLACEAHPKILGLPCPLSVKNLETFTYLRT